MTDPDPAPPVDLFGATVEVPEPVTLAGAGQAWQAWLDGALVPGSSTTRTTRPTFCRGEGETVVFVPTVPALGFVYLRLASHLVGRGFRVVLYEPATSSVARFGPQERCEELFAVLDDLACSPVHLVGWSDAGAVVSEALRRDPARVRSTTYLGTPRRYRLPWYVRYGRHLIEGGNRLLVPPHLVLVAVVAWLLGGPHVRSRDLFRRVHGIGDLAGLLRWSVLPLLDACNDVAGAPPALVMVGTEDRVVDVDAAAALAQSTGCGVRVVDGGDHFLPWSAPDAVNRAVEAHLRATAGSDPAPRYPTGQEHPG